jgi:Rps23 Pro-64 3,4-dihydroxylase Tpa1-like proline 4-hydroxylase
MELVKQQLKEQGYTYFNMNDYDMFSEDLKHYSKYICNESKNLKNQIRAIRIDGSAKDEFKSEFDNGKIQINSDYTNWEKAKAAMDEFSFKINSSPPFSPSQKWYFFHNNDINADFKKLANKIVKKLYDIDSEFENNSSITYYEPGCFLKKHQDGYVDGRICVILIYLNDSDYKPEWGGNLVFNDVDTIAPLFGNVAVLDFTTHNAYHEVKEVVDGYGRYAFLSFVSVKKVN